MQKKFKRKKNVKIKNREHAFKAHASTYNIEILNSFNLELQLRYTTSAIKSKLKELLKQLKGFEFVTTLVLVFKKIESVDKTKYDNFFFKLIISENDAYGMYQSMLQL